MNECLAQSRNFGGLDGKRDARLRLQGAGRRNACGLGHERRPGTLDDRPAGSGPWADLSKTAELTPI